MNKRIREIEWEIKKKTDEMNEYTLKYSIEVGKLLCEAKGLLKHGEWMNWASHNLPFGIATAGNLMKVYREYKDVAPESAILKLNYCVANELTKIACNVREETAKEILESGGTFRNAKETIAQKRGKNTKSEMFELGCKDAEAYSKLTEAQYTIRIIVEENKRLMEENKRLKNKILRAVEALDE